MSGFACATEEPPLPPDEKPAPHVALLLPLKSDAFAPAADAVRQGFFAAAGVEVANPRSLPVRVYGCFDEGKDISALYRQAVANGAQAVVGPLTRNGVAALASEQMLPVPTLALNVIDGKPADQLYFFGMALEAEARFIARDAGRQHQQAILISAYTQLSKRLLFSFEDEWLKNGGTILHEIEFNDDPEVLSALRATPGTAVFLALDAPTARLVGPYLPKGLPAYATSQVFVGNHDTLTNYDLNDIRFVDMPWLLQTDHPAVMIYPRATPPLPIDHERLYALGVDAFRLIQLLLDNKVRESMPLDGVSGHIDLDGHTFLRSAIPAVFVQGRAQLPNAPVAPIVPMFPGLMAVSSVPATDPLQ